MTFLSLRPFLNSSSLAWMMLSRWGRVNFVRFFYETKRCEQTTKKVSSIREMLEKHDWSTYPSVLLSLIILPILVQPAPSLTFQYVLDPIQPRDADRHLHELVQRLDVV
jgi:hypothetical protein